MSLLAQLLQPRAVTPGPLSDFWYTSVSRASAAGVNVSAETAQANSVVFACVRIISEALASLPLLVYHRLADEGRERATDHSLYRVLHERPNSYQTPFEFKDYVQRAALLSGNGIAVIVPGPNGAIEELLPWHPDKVTIERIRLGVAQSGVEIVVPRYRLTLSDGSTITLNREDVFHHRGFSHDGITGITVIKYARETIGLALATESYGARFFSQNAQPSGVLEHPGRLSKEAIERLSADWSAKHAGLENAHRIAILEEGMSWKPAGMTNEDAQFLASREFQTEEIARWFGVPLHMLGAAKGATSWGSGLEQLSAGYVRWTLMAWATRWEEAITRDLLIDSENYFVEYLMDALLRGDLASRNAGYAVGRQWGWLNVNEIRKKENMNPIDGGDTYLTPLNMGDPTKPPAIPPPAQSPSSALAMTRYSHLLHDAAARVMRREVGALVKATRLCAADMAAWQRAIDDFYADHADYVSEALGLSPEVAADWVGQQKTLLAIQGAAALATWETDRLQALIEIAGG